MKDTLVFERGEHIYLVAPVAPFDPAPNELEELAFAEDLKKLAPNENIGWLRGQYVEAERANENGAVWSSDELAIKSLTPMFMPVTVMHDPRSAVGLIADTKLLTREQHNVPRSRIDTTLGIWRHRFPQVWEEVAANYEQGSLMQSMECLPRYYDCGECGRRFPKLPGGAEKANWCAHLRGEENAKATRRLGNVTFTGTGLIFGTRGARGALDSAHLEVFQDEVAEAHERVHHERRRVRRTSTVDTIEIKRSEYDELKNAASRVDDLEKKVSTLEEAANKVPDLERKVEAEETAKKNAEKERDDLKKKVDEAEETARAAELSKERLGNLGTGFKGKLGEFTRERLEEQAGKLSDEEWDARLKELEETAGVKRDEGGKSSDDDDKTTFSREETARANLGGGGGGNGNGSEVAPAARRSVVAGLFGPKSSK
jgi:hypothetical protein